MKLKRLLAAFITVALAVSVLPSNVLASGSEQEPEETQTVVTSEPEEKETAAPSVKETEKPAEPEEKEPAETKETEPSETEASEPSESSETEASEPAGQEDKAPAETGKTETAEEKEIPSETAKKQPKKEVITEKSGNLIYSFDDESNKLTISGTGPIGSSGSDLAQPWSNYSDVAETIVICKGITMIGNRAFSLFKNVVFKNKDDVKCRKFIKIISFFKCVAVQHSLMITNSFTAGPSSITLNFDIVLLFEYVFCNNIKSDRTPKKI